MVRLERNYRSTQVILDAASGLISRNSERGDKRLWTDRAAGDPIVCHRARDEIEEADFVIARLRQALAGGRRLGGGPVPHQRAVARHRGSARPRGARLPGGRRRAVLRAQGRSRTRWRT